MVIKIKQGTKDSKKDFLDEIEFFESLGYIYFSGECYDVKNKLSEATMIKDEEYFNGNNLSGDSGNDKYLM
jgi:hypothetical protein